jgi:hypothetical protein
VQAVHGLEIRQGQGSTPGTLKKCGRLDAAAARFIDRKISRSSDS